MMSKLLSFAVAVRTRWNSGASKWPLGVRRRMTSSADEVSRMARFSRPWSESGEAEAPAGYASGMN
jgi:hypothetical protein